MSHLRYFLVGLIPILAILGLSALVALPTGLVLLSHNWNWLWLYLLGGVIPVYIQGREMCEREDFIKKFNSR